MMNMLQAVALSAVLVTTGAVTADAGGSGGKRPTKLTTLAADAPTRDRNRSKQADASDALCYDTALQCGYQW